MKYRIKIVPKATPNADGEWRDVEADLPPGTLWIDMAMTLAHHVPVTHFLCAIERHAIRCDACDAPTETQADDYGEHICTDCVQNRNERAAERLVEDFHDGGSTRFVSLLDQQAAARHLK